MLQIQFNLLKLSTNCGLQCIFELKTFFKKKKKFENLQEGCLFCVQLDNRKVFFVHQVLTPNFLSAFFFFRSINNIYLVLKLQEIRQSNRTLKVSTQIKKWGRRVQLNWKILEKVKKQKPGKTTCKLCLKVALIILQASSNCINK